MIGRQSNRKAILRRNRTCKGIFMVAEESHGATSSMTGSAE